MEINGVEGEGVSLAILSVFFLNAIASKIHKLKCLIFLCINKNVKKRQAASYFYIFLYHLRDTLFFGGWGVGLPGNLIVMTSNFLTIPL